MLKKSNPFEGCVPAEAACRVPLVDSRQVRRATWVAAVAVLGVAVLVLFSSSSVRIVAPDLIPNLREATRAAAPKRPGERFRSAGAHTATVSSSGPPALAKAVVHLRTVRPVFARVWRIREPVTRAPGSEALGTSLPKRMRWKALGGHGRHGPGAGL